MKKIISGFLCCMMMVTLTACNMGITTKDEVDTEHRFVATVVAVHENSIIVEPNEDSDERQVADRFLIEIKDGKTYRLGSVLKITYVGAVNESYPAQIGTTKVDVIDLGDLHSKTKSDVELKNEEVTLTLKENTVTAKGATFLLKNTSEKSFSYGNPYTLEVLKEEEWYPIPVFLSFTMPAFSLAAGEEKEIVVNWVNGYGILPTGTYRLIKDIAYEKEEGAYEQFYVGAEFMIP